MLVLHFFGYRTLGLDDSTIVVSVLTFLKSSWCFGALLCVGSSDVLPPLLNLILVFLFNPSPLPSCLPVVAVLLFFSVTLEQLWLPRALQLQIRCVVDKHILHLIGKLLYSIWMVDTKLVTRFIAPIKRMNGFPVSTAIWNFWSTFMLFPLYLCRTNPKL